MKQTKINIMKTFRLLGMIGLTAVLSLCFTACSSDDDNPIVEEETFIEGPMPKNLHVGMLYPISHDKKNDKCTFGIYLGEKPPQQMIDAMELQTVDIYMYDRYGKLYNYESGYIFDPSTGTYKDGLNTWNQEKGRGEFRHDDTLSLSCAACEVVTKIIICFRGSTLLDYYPELADMDDVKIKIQTWPNPGDINGYEIKQSWSSPHHWYF